MLNKSDRIGAFEIVSHVGSGGMGDVYRARDTKLGRDVALKVLPASLSDDPDRVARFRREAQLLASLNHPHIAQIHGFEEAGAVRALILEFVDGPTLAERIAVGAIPFDEALPVARQIADAVEAAHEQGIVHRDLKPANIKLRPDGTVKVLDFGLAKALDPATIASGAGGLGAVTMSPTMTSPAMTQMGVILGTAAYMSPEQAKGRAADKRSDVWAFGCVLYEILSGTRPFAGDDVSDTLAAVLRSEPEWSRLPPDVPGAVRALIQRCLVKDRNQRLGDLAAAQFVLRDPALLVSSTPAQTSPATASEQRRTQWLPIAAAVVATAVLAGASAWLLRPRGVAPPVARFTVDLPDGQQFATTTRHVLAISPDGTQIAYNAFVGGTNRLFIRSVSDFTVHSIPGADAGTSGNASLTFSPDGRSVAFWTLGTMRWIATTGGAAVEICQSDMPFGLSWDSSALVFGAGNKGVLRCAINGGASETLAAVDASEQAHGPQVLAGGKAVLFTVAKAGEGAARWDAAHIVWQPLPNGERKTIGTGSDARFLSSGHLVYVVGGVVFAAPFDPKTGVMSGPAVPVVEGVRRPSTGGTGAAQFAVSSTGTLAYVPGATRPATADRVLAIADRAGTVSKLPVPPAPFTHVRASPDGSQLAVATDDGKEAIVYIVESTGVRPMRRLTLTGQNRYPIWSPDGKRVAFQSDREGDRGIFVQTAAGTEKAERLTRPGRDEMHIPESWSPDGAHLSFAISGGPAFRLAALSLADKHVSAFEGVESREPPGSVFSPDGRWVAYYSSPNAGVGSGVASPNRGVYIQPFPPTGEIYQVPKQQIDFQPVWAPKGDALIFVPTAASGRLVSVGVVLKPTVTFGATTFLPGSVTANRLSGETRAYDVLPDGRFVGLISASEADAPGSPNAAAQIRVVLNWFEELKRRVPVK